jgi:hypothetical protein
VQVDGTVYTVEPGATFDDNFKLVAIDGTCATFLFGDQSLELCDTKDLGTPARHRRRSGWGRRVGERFRGHRRRAHGGAAAGPRGRPR